MIFANSTQEINTFHFDTASVNAFTFISNRLKYNESLKGFDIKSPED